MWTIACCRQINLHEWPWLSDLDLQSLKGNVRVKVSWTLRKIWIDTKQVQMHSLYYTVYAMSFWKLSISHLACCLQRFGGRKCFKTGFSAMPLLHWKQPLREQFQHRTWLSWFFLRFLCLQKGHRIRFFFSSGVVAKVKSISSNFCKKKQYISKLYPFVTFAIWWWNTCISFYKMTAISIKNGDHLDLLFWLWR